MPMLRLVRLEVGQLKSNCYLVWEKRGECVIIDPGDDADYIQRQVADNGLAPTQIVATHGHFDHVAAATELMLSYQIPFLAHRDDLFLIKRTRETTRHFVNFDPGPSPVPAQFIKDGDRLYLGAETLRVIGVPGHTPGSIALFHEPDRIIFVGDVIFAEGGVGRTDLGYANPLGLAGSIQKIKNLPGGTVVYPGHGEEFELST